jgi:hypothetical protein
MQDEREAGTDTGVGIDETRATSYERMCIALYAYRYRAIEFLDLIALFEEKLGLASPQTEAQTTRDPPE